MTLLRSRAGTMRLSPHHMTDAPCVSLLSSRRALAWRAAHRSPCLTCSSRRRRAASIQLESLPAGAEARASSGETCKTPCSLSVVAAENFSVTFSLPKYQPETVPVQLLRDPSGPGVTVDPNPVYAELQPALPGKKGARGAPKAAPKAKSALCGTRGRIAVSAAAGPLTPFHQRCLPNPEIHL